MMMRIFAIVGFLMLLVWGHLYAKPMHGGGSAIVPCDQTGLDFSLNCNMILIPALIH